jgi:hypothetical protein
MDGMRTVLLVSLTSALALACGDDSSSDADDTDDTDDTPGDIDAPSDDGVIDAAIDAPEPDANPRATLQGTGLCDDDACMTISPLAREYTPRFPLWSDTAEKRRWIMLPPGGVIDTSDPDFWKFPLGTKLWKEFSRGGVRVETRFMEKIQADDDLSGAWFFATYVWNSTQDMAVEMRDGVMDANGTMHDVPSRANCRECHDALHPTRVLGIGAIQMDFDAPGTGLDLDQMVTEGLLSVPPPGATTPHYPFAEDDSVTHQALGYMHANCGHCHNPTSSNFGHTQIQLRLTVGALDPIESSVVYGSAVDQVSNLTYTEGAETFTKIIDPGSPDTSSLIRRMTSTQLNRKMPYRGSEMPDLTGGIADLRAWVESLSP